MNHLHQHAKIQGEGSSGLMDKVSASQPRDRGFELHTGHAPHRSRP